MGLGGQWSPLLDGGLQDMLKAGSVAMTMGAVSAKGERLRLDENVEVLVPPSPVRLGKTVAFGVYMKTDSNMEQFTLRWEHEYLHITFLASVSFGILSSFSLIALFLQFVFVSDSFFLSSPRISFLLIHSLSLSHLSTPPPPPRG